MLKKLKNAVTFAISLSIIVLSSEVMARQMMSYQGYLSNKGTGAPVDTTVDLEFKIYDADTGGALLWSESQSGVVVSNGIFNVKLGQINEMGRINMSGRRFLEISIDGELISGRQELVAAPTTLSSSKLADNWEISVDCDNPGTADFDTIGEAVDWTLASSHGVKILISGTCNESVNLYGNASRLEFEGIDSPNAKVIGVEDTSAFNLHNEQEAKIKNLDIIGGIDGPDSDSQGAVGLNVTGSSRIYIVDSTIQGGGGALSASLSYGSDAEVGNSSFLGGISVYLGSNLSIGGSTISGYSSQAAVAAKLGASVWMDNTTLRGNDSWSLSASSGSVVGIMDSTVGPDLVVQQGEDFGGMLVLDGSTVILSGNVIVTGGDKGVEGAAILAGRNSDVNIGGAGNVISKGTGSYALYVFQGTTLRNQSSSGGTRDQVNGDINVYNNSTADFRFSTITGDFNAEVNSAILLREYETGTDTITGNITVGTGGTVRFTDAGGYDVKVNGNLTCTSSNSNSSFTSVKGVAVGSSNTNPQVTGTISGC